MNKKTIKLASVGALAIALSGCSLLLTDHSNDYRNESVNSVVLKVPAGALQARDDLVIPNENKIADLTKDSKFVVPRAVFVFYPMAKIAVESSQDSIVFDVPANMVQSKKMIKDFLMALHGDGESVATTADNKIVSVPFQFIKQGWWASIWSDISRNFPETIVFSFSFKETEKGTLVSVQYKVEENGKDTSGWMNPTSRNDVYADVIRLWGDMGRQVNKTSVYLSEQGNKTPFHVWIDHRGIFAIHLNSNNTTDDSLASQLALAGLKPVTGKENTLSVLPSKDTKQFSVAPIVGAGKVLAWDKREYKYNIVHQKAGDFLVIDVSASPNPEITSFLLAQRFVK